MPPRAARPAHWQARTGLPSRSEGYREKYSLIARRAEVSPMPHRIAESAADPVLTLGLPGVGTVFTGIGVLVILGLVAAVAFALIVRLQENRAARPGRVPRQGRSAPGSTTARDAGEKSAEAEAKGSGAKRQPRK